jgi:glycosyltransferase 2 family protein
MSGPEAGAPGVPRATDKGRLKRWARLLLRTAAVLFVILAARDLALRWGDSHIELSPGFALLACVPLFAACVVQGFSWIFLVERMSGKRVPKGPALALFLASQLARYTPGKVGLPLVRMDGAPRIGLARSLVGVSVFVEGASWAATAALLGFALLSGSTQAEGLVGLVGRLAPPLLVLSALGLLGLLLVDRSRYPQRLRTFLAPEGHGPVVPFGVPLVQLVFWALIALHGYLMSVAVGANASAAMSASGFFVIAPLAGFVVVAAPAGLGVREAVLLAGLGPLAGSAAALGAALLSRAATLAMEIVTWSIVRAVWGAPKSAGSPSP